ncbi:predicted protein [Coccidioides posadasii str. Silveira]|uniref:Predicted protein n=1 Tax=Coccidioides posadasii (strain RMSCC 757 / Silveira) TaxID=443226 RepID=E9DBG9_COCPS|nr:predicted protein [Coccidioides posadasii str. Silveira]
MIRMYRAYRLEGNSTAQCISSQLHSRHFLHLQTTIETRAKPDRNSRTTDVCEVPSNPTRDRQTAMFAAARSKPAEGNRHSPKSNIPNVVGDGQPMWSMMLTTFISKHAFCCHERFSRNFGGALKPQHALPGRYSEVMLELLAGAGCSALVGVHLSANAVYCREPFSLCQFVPFAIICSRERCVSCNYNITQLFTQPPVKDHGVFKNC